jgi:MFS family permease
MIVGRATRRNDRIWGPVMLLGLAFAINYADRQFFFAVFPQIQSGLGLSNTQLGLAGSLFAWSYALVMPLAGYVADRVARHRVVIAALLLWSVATLGTSLSQNLPQLLFWRVTMGLTEALFMPAAFGMVATLCPVTARSRALSTLGLAQFVGLAIGGIYGGWSAERIGWRHASQTLVLAGLLYAGLLVWRFWAFPYETNVEVQEHPQNLAVTSLLSARGHLFCFLRHALAHLRVAPNGGA